MQLLIISGSHRDLSQSAKVARHIEQRAATCFNRASVLDLARLDLPFWDEGAWDSDNETWKALLAPVNERLSDASAYVLVSPEWHGMVPSRLKNLLLFANARLVGHKPALIVTVSAGMGGSYPVNELRTSGYKNSRLCYIPEHVIVRDVEEMLNGAQPASDNDSYIRKRIDFALGGLHEYARVMAGMDRDRLMSRDFPNGM